jgi:XTP/dITP diphosphohydrolase
MQLIFATNNQHKLGEIDALLEDKYELLGLEELQISEEIPEDYDTLEKNASQKAWYIFDKTGKNCFADDTGLEVDILNGAPGVYSARYSRMGHPTFPELEAAQGNIKKLLLKMEGAESRSARFRTVISLVMDGKEYQFEGIVEGEISLNASGMKGFGYDPVFTPMGFDCTFAEMDLALKNQISHRAKALKLLVDFLKGM